MHAFLITQSTPEKRLDKARELISKRDIDNKNRFLLVKDLGKKSIGIEDTKELKRWMGQVLTKPRAALIEEAQLLTVPAQQSLLKTLEEPGDSAIVILTADSEISLLPTVRSRCKVIRLKSLSPQRLDSSSQAPRNDALSFPVILSESASWRRRVEGSSSSERILWLYGELSEYAGKRISPHQGSIGKETGLEFMEKVIKEVSSVIPAKAGIYIDNLNRFRLQGRNDMDIVVMAKILNEAAKAHARLKQNISPMLVLQEFVLNI